MNIAQFIFSSGPYSIGAYHKNKDLTDKCPILRISLCTRTVQSNIVHETQWRENCINILYICTYSYKRVSRQYEFKIKF